MTEGLVSTFEGRVAICLIFMVLGLLAATALTIAVMLRKAPPLTTQTNRETGVVEAGIFKWFLYFTAVFMGLPLLALIMVTGFELTAWFAGNMYVLPIIAAVLASVLVAALVIRSARRSTRTEAQVAVGMPPAAQGWSMPTDAQWPR